MMTMAMTRVQFVFAVGVGAIAIVLFAILIRPQHQAASLKADREAAPAAAHIVRTIPLYRPPPPDAPVKLAGPPPAPDAPLTPAAPSPRAEPPALKERDLLEPDQDPPTRRHWHEPAHGHDPCARHGMHKVVTHGGKSWRCRSYARR